MSRPVEIEELANDLAELAPAAYLCSVAADGRPKVVHVPIVVEGAGAGVELIAQVGPGTVANVADRPSVTLIWPGHDDQSMSLLVDAEAQASPIDGYPTLTPTGAVWHRPAPPMDLP